MPRIHRKAKKEDSDDDEDNEDENDGGEQHADDDVSGPAAPHQSALSDFLYNLEAELRQPSRNLVVKDLVLLFDPSTIYGQRAAFMKGLVVTTAPCPNKQTLFLTITHIQSSTTLRPHNVTPSMPAPVPTYIEPPVLNTTCWQPACWLASWMTASLLAFIRTTTGCQLAGSQVVGKLRQTLVLVGTISGSHLLGSEASFQISKCCHGRRCTSHHPQIRQS